MREPTGVVISLILVAAGRLLVEAGLGTQDSGLTAMDGGNTGNAGAIAGAGYRIRNSEDVVTPHFLRQS